MVTASVLAGCGGSESESSERAGGARAVSVLVEEVRLGTARDVRSYTGTLLPERRFTVAARTSGLLERLEVEIGDRVERNARVGQLENAEFVEDVRQAEAELAVARARYSAAVAEREVVNRELERVVSLRDRDFISEAEQDEVESRLISADAAVAVAESTLELREAVLRRARIRLDRSTLRALWEGSDNERFVSRRFLDEGSLVSENSAILEVVSLDPLIGEFYVPEADFYRIERGMPLEITTGGLGGRSFPAEVLRRSPEFSAETRRALVQVRVPNPDNLLAPGVFMLARMILDEQQDVPRIPTSALVERDSVEGVFVIDTDSEVSRFTPIERGYRDGDFVAVQGVEAGALVVTRGHNLLTDQTPVRWERAGDNLANQAR